MRIAYSSIEYQNGYEDALEDMRQIQRERKARQQARKARRWYFIKQRAAGVLLLAFTVLAVWVLDGDATIGLITVPLALCMIFGKDMMIVNDYYMEMERKKENAGIEITF